MIVIVIVILIGKKFVIVIENYIFFVIVIVIVTKNINHAVHYKTGKDHGQCTIIFQRRSFTTVYGKNTIVYERIRSVCGLCISPYTATEIYDRNTGSCNTAKYGRIRSVNSMYAVVYGVVNDRIQSP